jgi:chemotaxis protein MotA
MNFSSIFGLMSSNAVFFASVFITLGGLSGFMDGPSALIVIGGSISAGIVCVPFKSLKSTIRITINKVFKNSTPDYNQIISDTLALAVARKKGDSIFDQTRNTVKDPFLKDASGLLFWAEAEITEDEFLDLLEQKALTYTTATKDNGKVFKTLAKFPPAFGMMGTVLGLIALLQSLGNPDAKSQIGPAMAIALVTTLYGIAVNNLFIIPLGERLAKSSSEDDKAYRVAIEGLLLILQNKPTRYIEEKLRSFLMPDEISVSEKIGGSQKAA